MKVKYILRGIFIGLLIVIAGSLLAYKFFTYQYEEEHYNITSLSITDIEKDTAIGLRVNSRSIVFAAVRVKGKINENCELQLTTKPLKILLKGSSTYEIYGGDTLRIPLERGEVDFKRTFDWFHDKTFLHFKHLKATEGNLDISVNLADSP